MNPMLVAEAVSRALEEDLGSGDITTDAIVPAEAIANAHIVAKEAGVIAGLDVAEAAFHMLDPGCRFEKLVSDGTPISPGHQVAAVRGRARAILSAERVALNFLQRLSGIATETARVVEAVKRYDTRITDTRKTAPGLRALDKYAVRVGGGRNHRFGLYDGILIKDNHISLAGGVRPAVERARRYAGHAVKIEVEARSLAEVEEALGCNVDIILLDNMDVEALRRAVQLANGRCLLEASGGISPQNVAEVAATGVDLISLGWLTHSARALDISMEVDGGGIAV